VLWVFSCAKQTRQADCQKDYGENDFHLDSTFLWIGELFISGDLGNSQKGRERSELGSIHRELYHAQPGSPILRVHVAMGIALNSQPELYVDSRQACEVT
jgi:hypothetical protein